MRGEGGTAVIYKEEEGGGGVSIRCGRHRKLKDQKKVFLDRICDSF